MTAFALQPIGVDSLQEELAAIRQFRESVRMAMRRGAARDPELCRLLESFDALTAEQLELQFVRESELSLDPDTDVEELELDLQQIEIELNQILIDAHSYLGAISQVQDNTGRRRDARSALILEPVD